jgi:DNA-binding NarL/FixJ family response regulator
VLAFPDCEEAFANLASARNPDVLLLDLGLPGISGTEAIGRFKTEAPNLKILVLTSHDDNDKIFKALCAGANGYLLKSSSMMDLKLAIEETLAGGSPMSPLVATSVLNMFAKMGQAHAGNADYGLAPREKQALEAMVKGLTVKEIADQMGVSYHTADTYVRSIYTKLHVNSRGSAVAKAIREHLS